MGLLYVGCLLPFQIGQNRVVVGGVVGDLRCQHLEAQGADGGGVENEVLRDAVLLSGADLVEGAVGDIAVGVEIGMPLGVGVPVVDQITVSAVLRLTAVGGVEIPGQNDGKLLPRVGIGNGGQRSTAHLLSERPSA